MIGAVTARKGQRELIAALPELVAKFPDLKVALIGQFDKKSDYYADLRKSLFEKRLFRRVIWMGRRNNVHELVQGLDACIVPSLKEPLGLCALEAMAAGVPVVASNIGGLKEFVIPEKTGLLFDPRHATAIAQATARALTDMTLRTAVIQNSRQMLLDRFSPAAITTQIESALASVVRPDRVVISA